MKVEIEFVKDVVGHDLDTIQQMYNDWNNSPSLKTRAKSSVNDLITDKESVPLDGLVSKGDPQPVQKPDIEAFVNNFISQKLYDYGLIEHHSFCQRGSVKGDLIYKDLKESIERLLSC